MYKVFFNAVDRLIIENHNELFNMIVKYRIQMIDTDNFIFTNPTEAYFNKQNYSYYKNALREFAKEWQYNILNTDVSYGDMLSWFTFFNKYGKRYGLLREFRENGII